MADIMTLPAPWANFDNPIELAQAYELNRLRNRLMDMKLRDEEERRGFLQMQSLYEQNPPQPEQFTLDIPPMMNPAVPPPIPKSSAFWEANPEIRPDAVIPGSQVTVSEPVPYINPEAAKKYPMQALQYQRDRESEEIKNASEIGEMLSRFKDKNTLKAVLPALVKIRPDLANIDLDQLTYEDDGSLSYNIPGVGTWVRAPSSWGGQTQFIKEGQDLASLNAGSLYERGRLQQLVRGGMDPADAAVQASREARDLGFSEKVQLINYRNDITSRDPNFFGNWAPEEQEREFINFLLTDRPPAAMRDKEQIRAFRHAYNSWAVNKGITPGMQQAIRADLKARDKSFTRQRTMYDPLNSFVQNMDKQMIRIADLQDKIRREYARIQAGQAPMIRKNGKLVPASPGDMRALRTDADLIFTKPATEWRKKVKGKGLELALASYMNDLSMEAAKIGGGAQNSIAEPSVDAQKRWREIHNEALPFNEMNTVLTATYHQGHDRKRSLEEAMQWTLDGINNLGSTTGVPVPYQHPPTPPQVDNTPPFIKKEAGETRSRTPALRPLPKGYSNKTRLLKYLKSVPQNAKTTEAELRNYIDRTYSGAW